MENLQDQGVVAVRRITIFRECKKLPTKHIILTFNTPDLPTSIKAAYLKCSIRPFIPNPLRCYKCQRFGHSKDSCRGSVTCARCAGNHDSENCQLPPLCVNCKNDHPSFSRTCPLWTFEKEVQTVKIVRKISFPEARKRVSARTPQDGKSYAAAVSKSFSTIATQTD